MEEHVDRGRVSEWCSGFLDYRRRVPAICKLRIPYLRAMFQWPSRQSMRESGGTVYAQQSPMGAGGMPSAAPGYSPSSPNVYSPTSPYLAPSCLAAARHRHSAPLPTLHHPSTTGLADQPRGPPSAE